MVDRIQGNNFRVGIFAGADIPPVGFNPIILAEILARVSQDRFQLQLDEALGEISHSYSNLGEISKRIQKLILLQKESNEEIERALKELESDPSSLDWELHLIKFLKTHRFRHLATAIDLDNEKIAHAFAKRLAKQIGKIAIAPRELTRDTIQANEPNLPAAAPTVPRIVQEPVVAIQPVQVVAAPMAQLDTFAQALISVPYYEHRYKKMDADLDKVKQSLEQLRASIKVIQEGKLQKNRPLFKRLFALLAALFGHIFSPGLNSGRRIVDVRLKKQHAPGA